MTREKAYALRALIEKAAASLPDEDALEGVELFPKWAADIAVTAGERYGYGGKLYKVLQGHTTQADWTPDIAVSLFAEVAAEEQGTRENPIPYNGNMALENGKYYSQDGVTYRCFRDTINPVYAALADLVGLYVEVAV